MPASAGRGARGGGPGRRHPQGCGSWRRVAAGLAGAASRRATARRCGPRQASLQDARGVPRWLPRLWARQPPPLA
eukprot:9037544-Heterocapsa_arctica.AAC.1